MNNRLPTFKKSVFSASGAAQVDICTPIAGLIFLLDEVEQYCTCRMC